MNKTKLKKLFAGSSLMASLAITNITEAAQDFAPDNMHQFLSSISAINEDTININYTTNNYNGVFNIDEPAYYWINVNIGTLNPDTLSITSVAAPGTAGTTISSVNRTGADNKIDIHLADGLALNLATGDALGTLQIGTATGGSAVYISNTGITFNTNFTSVGSNNIFGYGGASCIFNGNIGAAGAGNSFSAVEIGQYPATFNGYIYATNVKLLVQNSGIILGDGANVTGDIKNYSGVSGNNTAIGISGESTITGDIGSADRHIGNLTLQAGANLTVSGNVFVDSIPVQTDNSAILTLGQVDDTTITGNIGSLNNNFTLGVMGGGNLLQFLNIGDAGGADYTISGDIISTYDLRFVTASHRDTNLMLGALSGNAQYIAGNLTSETGSKGIINIGDNVVLGGSIGSSAVNKPYNIRLNTANKSLTLSGNAIYAENIAFEASGTGVNLTSANNVNISINSPITVNTNGYGAIRTLPTNFYYNGSQFIADAQGRFENTLTFSNGSTIGDLNGNALDVIDVQDGAVSFADNANVNTIKASEVSVAAGKTLKTNTISHINDMSENDGQLYVTVSGTLNATTVNGNLSAIGASSGNISSITGSLAVGASVADSLIVTDVGGGLVFTSDGNLSLADGGTLHAVTSNTINTGNLKLLGDAMLDNNLEKIKTLTISGASGKVVDFMGSNISGNVTHGAATLSLNNNTVISGAYAANGSTIILDNNSMPNTLSVVGATTLVGDLTINAIYSEDNDYYVADFSAAGSNYAALTGITINMDMQNNISEDMEVQLIKVVPGTAIAFNDKIKVNDPLPIFFWTKSTTTPGAFSVMKQPENFGANFEQAYIDSRKILTALTNGNATPEFEIQAARILAADPVAFQELVSRIETSVTNSVSSAFSGGATSQISQIPQFSISSATSTASVRLDNIGVAAGSLSDRFGVWSSMQGSNSRQTSYKGSSGFKSNGFGAVIGGDTKLNDNNVIGFVVGNNATNVKHKDTLLGDKTRVSSWLFGLYGQHQINDNWFVRGTGIVSQANIDNKSRRVADIGNVYGIARAKYDVVSLGVDASLGYIMPFANNSSITPTVGAKFYYTNAIDYVENGNTIQNNKVHQEAMSTVALNAGVTLATNFELENGTNLSPSLSFSGEYGLGSKTPKGTFINQGTPTLTHSYVGTKPARFMGTLGGGIDVVHDSIEYGINYNARLATKYVSHEGAVKFRVLF